MKFEARTGWTHEHAPGASLDYGFDWKSNGWLKPGEIITASEWAPAPAGIELSRAQLLEARGITSVFATGGVAGYQYRITNTITTSQGRKDSRSITLVCKAR